MPKHSRQLRPRGTQAATTYLAGPGELAQAEQISLDPDRLMVPYFTLQQAVEALFASATDGTGNPVSLQPLIDAIHAVEDDLEELAAVHGIDHETVEELLMRVEAVEVAVLAAQSRADDAFDLGEDATASALAAAGAAGDAATEAAEAQAQATTAAGAAATAASAAAAANANAVTANSNATAAHTLATGHTTRLNVLEAAKLVADAALATVTALVADHTTLITAATTLALDAQDAAADATANAALAASEAEAAAVAAASALAAIGHIEDDLADAGNLAADAQTIALAASSDAATAQATANSALSLAGTTNTTATAAQTAVTSALAELVAQASLRYGTIPAHSGTGDNGDFYIDTTLHTVSGPKTAGSWPTPVSMVGTAGAAGSTGAAGPAGTFAATSGTVVTYDSVTGIASVTISGVGTVSATNYTTRGLSAGTTVILATMSPSGWGIVGGAASFGYAGVASTYTYTLPGYTITPTTNIYPAPYSSTPTVRLPQGGPLSNLVTGEKKSKLGGTFATDAANVLGYGTGATVTLTTSAVRVISPGGSIGELGLWPGATAPSSPFFLFSDLYCSSTTGGLWRWLPGSGAWENIFTTVEIAVTVSGNMAFNDAGWALLTTGTGVGSFARVAYIKPPVGGATPVRAIQSGAIPLGASPSVGIYRHPSTTTAWVLMGQDNTGACYPATGNVNDLTSGWTLRANTYNVLSADTFCATPDGGCFFLGYDGSSFSATKYLVKLRANGTVENTWAAPAMATTNFESAPVTSGLGCYMTALSNTECLIFRVASTSSFTPVTDALNLAWNAVVIRTTGYTWNIPWYRNMQAQSVGHVAGSSMTRALLDTVHDLGGGHYELGMTWTYTASSTTYNNRYVFQLDVS